MISIVYKTDQVIQAVFRNDWHFSKTVNPDMLVREWHVESLKFTHLNLVHVRLIRDVM